MDREGMGMSGQVQMVLTDRYGFIKEERDGPNLVMNAGITEIVKHMAGVAADAFTHVAIGVGVTAPAVTQTALVSESSTNGGGRDASTVTAETESTTGDTIQLISGWNFSGDLTLTESGVFNAGAVGDMLCRQTFTALPVGNGDSLTITWKVTLDQV